MATSENNFILKRFANQIHIDVDPQIFTFYCGQSILQLSTFLHVDETGKDINVVDVGKLNDIPNAIRLTIFSDYYAISRQLRVADLVSTFLRFAIRKIIRRRTIIRPIIYFKNVDRLNDCCQGKQESILREAAIASGAMLIYFE